MRLLRSVQELRAALEQPRRAGIRIGLVPTMGALHEGHLSLIARSHERCGLTVVSLFVNPSQFNDPSDLRSYPRQEDRDRLLAERAGADILFAPPFEEVYPPGFCTSVQVHGLTDRLEGASRGAGHFQGVTTVVSKLLAMVLPDVAFFGQKDAQQVLVISRMVRDLDMPVQIESCPTVREPDGLAMSSRNALLSPSERLQALAIPGALQAARELVAAGESDGQRIQATAHEVLARTGLQSDYVELVDPQTLEPMGLLEDQALLVLAVRAGAVRLIDNLLLAPLTEAQPSTPPLRTPADRGPIDGQPDREAIRCSA